MPTRGSPRRQVRSSEIPAKPLGPACPIHNQTDESDLDRGPFLHHALAIGADDEVEVLIEAARPFLAMSDGRRSRRESPCPRLTRGKSLTGRPPCRRRRRGRGGRRAGQAGSGSGVVSNWTHWTGRCQECADGVGVGSAGRAAGGCLTSNSSIGSIGSIRSIRSITPTVRRAAGRYARGCQGGSGLATPPVATLRDPVRNHGVAEGPVFRGKLQTRGLPCGRTAVCY